MTFRHSHTDRHTILGFLVRFSVNNLCFLVFSSLCTRSMYYLSIAFSHSVQTHTHTRSHIHSTHTHTHTPLFLKRLPRMTKTQHYLLLFIIADGAIISWPRHLSFLLPLHMFLFIQTSPYLSFLPSPPLRAFMFIQICLPLFLSIFLPSFSPSAPMCPAFVTSLVSITTATFHSVHNQF